MGSFFEDMARHSAELMMAAHGERDEQTGDFAYHVIALPSGVLLLWRASVGELSETYVEQNGKLVARETCRLLGPTAELATGSSPLPTKAQVTVPKYGATPFNVDTSGCRYGGAFTTIALIRAPIARLGNLHATDNA